MNPAIAQLRTLAQIDEKLGRIRERRREKDEDVRAAEDGLASAEEHLDARAEEIKRLRKEADALNLDFASVEQGVERLTAQLRAAKSNKEYEILSREVEAAGGKKSDLEDGVLERLERVDAIIEEEKAGRVRAEEARTSAEEARNAAAETEKELAKEEASLRDGRGGVLTKLDAETRHLYEALLEQRGDSALARVADGVCSACARKLSSQLENLVAVGEEIVQCMSCQRIFYVDDGERNGDTLRGSPVG